MVRNIASIAAKELKLSFVTPTAHVIIAGFVFVAGFFFFTLLQQFNNILSQAAMMPDMNPSLNEWVVVPFYQTLEIVLVFLIPLLTMRSVAEERRSGTFEMLITSPLSSGEIIFGKFLGIAITIALMIALAAIYPLILVVFADPEVPPLLVGLLGSLLFGISFSAIGLAISAFTKSQTIAGVISLVALLLFYMIDAPSAHFGETGAAIFRYLAPSFHTMPFLQGVFEGSHLVYFASVICFGLFFANRALEAERWR